MKINLKDGLSQEWGHKLKNITVGKMVKISALIAVAFVLIGGHCGYQYFVAKNFTPTQKYIKSIVTEYDVRRHFSGQAYGTFWDICSVTITADHVPAEMTDDGVSFVGRPVTRSNGIIDAAHYGEWGCDAPRAPIVGEKVSIIGYPGGSVHPALRKGEIYLKRGTSGSPGYEQATWIIVFDSGEPVVGGMSGGIVISEDGTPLGPLVTQNSETFFAKFNASKHSSDFVALSDYFEHVIETK